MCGRLASPGELRVFASGTRLLRLLITVRNAHYPRCYVQTWSSLLSAIGNDIWRRLFPRGGSELPPRLCFVLLTDGASWGVIHRHRPSRRIRETPGSEHYWALTRTNQHPPEGTHNPKVVGSNPTPATKSRRRPPGPLFSFLGVACAGFELVMAASSSPPKNDRRW